MTYYFLATREKQKTEESLIQKNIRRSEVRFPQEDGISVKCHVNSGSYLLLYKFVSRAATSVSLTSIGELTNKKLGD